MAAVIIHSDFGAQENKICQYFHFSPMYLPWSAGTRCHDLHFLHLSLKPAFSHSSFTFIRKLLVPLCFLPLEWYHLLIRGCWYFSRQSWFEGRIKSYGRDFWKRTKDDRRTNVFENVKKKHIQLKEHFNWELSKYIK